MQSPYLQIEDYLDMTEAQMNEYRQFMEGLCDWLRKNTEVRAIFGWTSKGDLMLGLSIGTSGIHVRAGRNDSKKDLFKFLDECKKKILGQSNLPVTVHEEKAEEPDWMSW
jgi:hypothetical protein